MAKQGKLRVIFNQQIFRKNDEKLIVNARFITVLTKNNRPVSSDIFVRKMEEAGILMVEV
jgi:acyl-CoA thioester hydrolase